MFNTTILSVVILVTALSSFAQRESFESPAPVLISQNTSTRALTILPKLGRGRGRVAPPSVFMPGSTATIFVTNLTLQPGEGANSIRLYAEDSAKHIYKFPIVSMRQVTGMDWVIAVTFRLEDEIGYWNPPSPDGDLLVSVSWRGMQSNRVRVAFGAVGGSIKDDAGAMPTPLPLTRPAAQARFQEAAIGEGRWGRDAMRLLEQSTFGPTVQLEERVKALGMRSWLDEQLKMPYSEYEATYPNLPLMPYDSNVGCPSTGPANCMRDNYWHYQMPLWFFRQAFYGEQQLRHRVAWALSQIWVVSANTQQPAWMMHYHRVLARNAFGNWRQMMKEMTLNPAMGNYLDMMRSTKWEPNENYAREVLQLFNIGLFMLNQDGTVQLDAQGQRIPTYTQQTVENFARVFTGWSLCETAGCPSRSVGAPNFKDSMMLSNSSNHDILAKTLLSYPGVTNQYVPQCTGCNGTAVVTYANTSMDQALDNIYSHPNVAPFVSKLLIQHLVTSDPSPAFVQRIATVFDQNRTNQYQMREVVKAILLDPEARGSVKTDPRYGKLREPVQLVTNMFRPLNVSSSDFAGQSDGNVEWDLENLGQGAFLSPTVFNYYQPDFNVPGTNLLGPEFGLYTTGTAVSRANLVQRFTYWGINADGDWNPKGTRLNMSNLEAMISADQTGNLLLDDLDRRMLHGTMTAGMRAKILSAMSDLSTSQVREKVQTAVYLVASSLQFQVQR